MENRPFAENPNTTPICQEEDAVSVEDAHQHGERLQVHLDQRYTYHRWHPFPGDDRGNNSDERRREHRRLQLTFRPLCVMELTNNDNIFRPALNLRINDNDVAMFRRFFRINGFEYQYIVCNTLYFSCRNRDASEVVSVVNDIKEHIKSICFARFCGEFVAGYEITDPEDILCSFGLQVMNGNMQSILSTTMFA